MKEYIERKAVLQNFKEVKPVNWDNTEYEKQAITDYNFYRSIVENTLAADVTPVVHGEWILDKDMYELLECIVYSCSVCGRLEGKQEPYCNCGAKMDGGNK